MLFHVFLGVCFSLNGKDYVYASSVHMIDENNIAIIVVLIQNNGKI